MRILALLLFLTGLFVKNQLFAQAREPYMANIKLQYGVSLNLRWEIVFKYGYLSNYRLDLGTGLGAMIENNFMPFSQLSFSLFQGGLGSSLSVHERTKINVESSFALGLMAGSRRSNDIFYKRPVYTMGRMMPTPLYNPFGWYGSLASTFIYRISKFHTPNSLGKHRFSQRVGSLTFGASNFDFNYYNDATPYHWMGLGDGRDRYWTGGGLLNIHIGNRFDFSHLNNNNNSSGQNIVKNIFFGFDRFTGFYPESFEVANALGLNNVPYGDKTQAFFNKGRFFVGIDWAPVPGLSTFFSWNDQRNDFQYLIHRKREQPLHKTLHKPSNGLNTSYTNNYWQLIKQ